MNKQKFYLDKDNRVLYYDEVKKGDTVRVSRRVWSRRCKQYKRLPCEVLVTKVNSDFFYAGGFKFTIKPNIAGSYFNVVKGNLPTVEAEVIIRGGII